MTDQLTKIGNREILGHTVTVFGTVENPLFLARDVAKWIEHSNVSAMLEGVEPDEKIIIEMATPDSKQSLESGNLRTKRWFLTENGLYEVLFLSRKPVATRRVILYRPVYRYMLMANLLFLYEYANRFASHTQ